MNTQLKSQHNYRHGTLYLEVLSGVFCYKESTTISNCDTTISNNMMSHNVKLKFKFKVRGLSEVQHKLHLWFCSGFAFRLGTSSTPPLKFYILNPTEICPVNSASIALSITIHMHYYHRVKAFARCALRTPMSPSFPTPIKYLRACTFLYTRNLRALLVISAQFIEFTIHSALAVLHCIAAPFKKIFKYPPKDPRLVI
jgi:hypothetical protein